MDILISASLITAFLAGIAALFAPCCITVLLPTYFASIFKKKTTVFLMTFIYFLGILSVFLPIGLGIGALSEIFNKYHSVTFSIGAVFLIFLGLSLMLGKHLSLPMIVHPSLKKTDVGSIYLLGIFSGVATSCCAPVLAGVIALSAIPGSTFLGGVYTLAYVLGMVIPLFIIATFMDSFKIMDKIKFFRKEIKIANIGVSVPNLISGFMFLLIGILTLFYARQNQLSSHSSFQVTVNAFINKMNNYSSFIVKLVPQFILTGLFVIIFLLLSKKAYREFKNIRKEKNE